MASFAVSALILVANWFLYLKMGREGWEGIVPFYNAYVLFEEFYGSGWKFLLLFVPVFNIYVAIRMTIDLAHSFGKSGGFVLGMFLLSPVFLMILAFDKSIVYERLDGLHMP